MYKTVNETFEMAKILTGSFAGCAGRSITLVETRMTMTLVGTFDIDAQL